MGRLDDGKRNILWGWPNHEAILPPTETPSTGTLNTRKCYREYFLDVL